MAMMNRLCKIFILYVWYCCAIRECHGFVAEDKMRRFLRDRSIYDVSQVSLRSSFGYSYDYQYDVDYEYKTNKFVRNQLEKESGAMYRQSIFTSTEFSEIQRELSTILTQLNEETASSVATNRLGASIPLDSKTVEILQQGSLHKFIQRVTGDDSVQLSFDLPVEVRTYEKQGAGMAWHEDDVLYDPPQIEVVITLENNSDCVTMWKDKNGKVISKETDPNSALILKAGGPPHCVTSLKRGRRIILKCAFASKTATFREGIHRDQFGTSKGKKMKNRRKGKR